MNVPNSLAIRRKPAVLLLLAALGGCVPPAPSTPAADNSTAGLAEIAVTANPLASQAALAVLKQGGTAVDAAVAAQAVLGLVEPQASGPGGGSVLLVWDAAAAKLSVFDGTPRAGHNAAAGLNADPSGRPLDPGEVMYGGGAVGVPGTLPALWGAHRAAGKLPWAALFAPAIKLADDGFPMPRALHTLLSAPAAASSYASVLALYGGVVPPVGASVRNPAYAATLRRVAQRGADGLFAGDGLREMLAALNRGPQSSLLTEADLRGYTVTQPAPVCVQWRDWKLCTAPPPSFGGLLALQILAMAGPGDLSDAGYAHRFLDAGRLAQADRRRFAGDPDRVPVPVAQLLDPAYLAARAALIAPDRALQHPKPGNLRQEQGDARRDDPSAPTTATSQVVVVDRAGNAVSMTSSLTHNFGARVLAGGMPLNNALVDFAPMPPSGVRYANDMEPDKRPVTPKAPVMAFDAQGRLVLLGGSGGGPGTPDFVAAALLDMLPGARAPAEVVARPHITSADIDHVTVETGTTAEQLLPALRAMGHQAEAEPLPSGSAFARRTARGWQGAADPRRDGVALGD